MNIFAWKYVLAALAAIVIFNSLPPKWRIRFMAGVSLLWVIFQNAPMPFIGYVFALITMATLLFGWLLGRFIHKRTDPIKRKWALGFSVLVALFPILFFRYMFGDLVLNRQLLALTAKAGVEIGMILAPLGISYFTFRIVCYLIEIYKKNIEPISPSEYLAYVTFFPTMLAGPIERVGSFIKQSRSGHRVDRMDITEGLIRILQGLFKKMIISNALYELCLPLLSLPTGAGFNAGLQGLSAWQLHILSVWYYLYLWIDFSAYSDIAIGTARLCGFRIMENFNWPILAQNIAQFWGRWHLSLTTWVQDYVYYPLGGNRGSALRNIFNTIFAMAIVGLWHGVASHYVAFGIYHGCLLVVYRYYRRWKTEKFPDRQPTLWGKIAGWALTLNMINIGSILFNFNIKHSILIVLKMYGLN